MLRLNKSQRREASKGREEPSETSVILPPVISRSKATNGHGIQSHSNTSRNKQLIQASQFKSVSPIISSQKNGSRFGGANHSTLLPSSKIQDSSAEEAYPMGMDQNFGSLVSRQKSIDNPQESKRSSQSVTKMAGGLAQKRDFSGAIDSSSNQRYMLTNISSSIRKRNVKDFGSKEESEVEKQSIERQKFMKESNDRLLRIEKMDRDRKLKFYEEMQKLQNEKLRYTPKGDSSQGNSIGPGSKRFSERSYF